MKIIITGASGFIGKNLIERFHNKYLFYTFDRKNSFKIKDEEVVIHLAGKAHDLKKTANPQEYYDANASLTKEVYDEFIESKAKVLITMSSVKAIVDSTENIITEETIENPQTHYGKSKLQADQYILSKPIPKGKRIYILRPCMIHGKGNKGNLNLLYKLITKRIPWPLGTFNNKRSYCSIENLLFIIQELMSNSEIPSGIYTIADDDALSTNEVITLIGRTTNIKTRIYSIPRILVKIIAKIGDLTYLPLNSERLQKLTESYIVDNSKIKKALNKPLPVTSEEGLIQTFKFFHEN
mgnify:CR=1 FL=1